MQSLVYSMCSEVADPQNSTHTLGPVFLGSSPALPLMVYGPEQVAAPPGPSSAPWRSGREERDLLSRWNLTGGGLPERAPQADTPSMK